MPRIKRILSIKSYVYHVILRGIDQQEIFYNDADRKFFLKHLLEVKKKFELEIYAYCLMDNHIHLVFRSPNNLVSKAIQSLAIRYSQYFNRKYKRSGAFFEDRFKSKNIENQQYFMSVCRYVHRNPEKAGFSKTEDYKWSSYNEYLNKDKIINKKVLLHYFDNKIDNFVDFTISQKIDLYQELKEDIEYEYTNKLSDEYLIKVIKENLNLDSITDISKFDKKKRDKIILELKNIPGTNKTQMARIMRMNRKVIERVWNKDTI